MKNTHPKATKTVYPIICQIVNVIPTQFIAEAAKDHKILSRTFHDFIGCGENAVQWQVWTELLAHLILQYLAYLLKIKQHRYRGVAGMREAEPKR